MGADSLFHLSEATRPGDFSEIVSLSLNYHSSLLNIPLQMQMIEGEFISYQETKPVLRY